MDKNITEVKKLKKVEFAVEAMETSDATIKNEPNDEVAKIKERVEGRKIAMNANCGLNSAQWSRVDNGQDEEPVGIIEPSGVVVVGTSQRERRIRITS